MLNFKQSTANNKILIIVVFVFEIYIYYKKIDKNSENIPLIFFIFDIIFYDITLQ